jgi:glycosyltransferase involved in cell wall biosynthesis
VVQITDAPTAAIAPGIFGRPVIYSVRGKMNRLYQRLLGRFSGLIFWGASADMYPSAKPEVPTLIVTPGVDTDLFKPTRDPQALIRHGLGQRPVIVFVGRFVAPKNLDFMVEAFSQAVAQGLDADLLLVGDGPLSERVKTMVERSSASERITIAGRIEQEQLPALYTAASACVLTSLHENYPIVLLEAMACGLPVVAPDVGGIPKIVQNERTGRLYSSGDKHDFHSALSAVLEYDPEQIRPRCRESVESGFGWQDRARQVHGLHLMVTNTEGEASDV